MCFQGEESVFVVRVSISTLISGGRENLGVGCFEVDKDFTLLSGSHSPWFLVSLNTRSQRGEPPLSFRSARSELVAACSTSGSSRLCCLRLLLSPCQYLVVVVRWLKKKRQLNENEGHGSFVIKKKQWKTPRLQFAQPRRPASSTSYKQRMPVEVDACAWLWKLRERKLRKTDRGWTLLWRENFQFNSLSPCRSHLVFIFCLLFCSHSVCSSLPWGSFYLILRSSVAAVTPGHPNLSLCPVCVGVQRREFWLGVLRSATLLERFGKPNFGSIRRFRTMTGLAIENWIEKCSQTVRKFWSTWPRTESNFRFGLTSCRSQNMPSEVRHSYVRCSTVFLS